MTTYNTHKVTAVPATFDANDIYFVAPTGRPDALEIYVANSAGDALRRAITEADVGVLITAALDTIDQAILVNDIAERDTLTIRGEVIVVDATADPTVGSGGAKYYANAAGDAWVKLSETESMDVILAWESIVGKPSSTPAQIDQAVTDSHTHANKTQLDKIDQDADGNFTYDGNLPAIGWATASW